MKGFFNWLIVDPHEYLFKVQYYYRKSVKHTHCINGINTLLIMCTQEKHVSLMHNHCVFVQHSLLLNLVCTLNTLCSSIHSLYAIKMCVHCSFCHGNVMLVTPNCTFVRRQLSSLFSLFQTHISTCYYCVNRDSIHWTCKKTGNQCFIN